MTIEIFTIEDTKQQLIDIFKMKLEAEGLDEYRFIRSLHDVNIRKDKLDKEFCDYLYKFGFIQPTTELNKEHLTHVLAKSLTGPEWFIVYSTEETLEELYSQQGKLLSILTKNLDDQKHGPFRILDFDRKLTELFVKDLH